MTDATLTPARSGTAQHIAYVLKENPVTALSFGMFAFFLASAIVGPALVPYDPLTTDAVNALQPPSAHHWFGTDNLGRDVFSRVIVATRLDLVISVAAVILSFVIGSVLGAIAGYRGGWTDTILNRCLDTIMAFPLFVLLNLIIDLTYSVIDPRFGSASQ